MNRPSRNHANSTVPAPGHSAGAMGLTPRPAAGTGPSETPSTAARFRVKGRRLLHRLAHQEYGVVFSLCGVRSTAYGVELDPTDAAAEDHCGNCARVAPSG